MVLKNESSEIGRSGRQLGQANVSRYDLNNIEIGLYWQAQKKVNTIKALQELLDTISFSLRLNLPMRNASFVGRVSLQEQIYKELSKHDSKKAVILFGPGGVGKTQLALKYCWEYKSSYSTILWFNAASVDSIRASFLACANRIISHYLSQLPGNLVSIGLIAQYLQLKDLVNPDGTVVAEGDHALDSVADAVKLWLDSEKNNNWLAVYDSYEPEHFHLDSYLPSARSGTIIITTRRRASLPVGNMIEVPCFSMKESMELLVQRSQKDIQLPGSERK